MKIAFDPEKFGDLQPGDEVQLMAAGVVSDDGKSIEVISVEDEELEVEDDDEEEGERKRPKETPKERTEEDEEEALAEGADLGAIIASGFGNR